MAMTEELIFSATLDDKKFNQAAAKMRSSAEQAGTAAANAGKKFSNAANSTKSLSGSTVSLGAKLKNMEPTIGKAASGMSGMAGAMGGAVGQTNALGGAVAGVAGAFSGGGLLAVGIAGITLGLGYLYEATKKANEEAAKAHTAWVDGYAGALKEARDSTREMDSQVKSLEDRIGELTMGTFAYQRQLVIGRKMELMLAREELSNVDEKIAIIEEESAALEKAGADAKRRLKERRGGDKAELQVAVLIYGQEMKRIRLRESALESQKLDLSFQGQHLGIIDDKIEKTEHLVELMDRERELSTKVTKETEKQARVIGEKATVTSRIISVEKISDDLAFWFQHFDDIKNEEARVLEEQKKRRMDAFSERSRMQREQAEEEVRIEKEKQSEIEAAEKSSQERKLAELRIYTGEAATLINGAFALSLDALEAVAAGEKIMLHEMIIAYTTSSMKAAGIRIFASGLAGFIAGMIENAALPGSGAALVSSGATAMGIGASLGAGGAVGSGLATRFGIVGGAPGGGGQASSGMTPGVNGGSISSSGSRGRSDDSGQQRNVYIFNSPVYSDATETAKNASRLQRIARDDLLERV